MTWDAHLTVVKASGQEDWRLTVAERLEDVFDIHMRRAMIHDLVMKSFVLRRRGKLSPNQQVRGFEKAGFLGKLLDGIPSVAQYTTVPVYKRDIRLDYGRVEEATINDSEADFFLVSRLWILIDLRSRSIIRYSVVYRGAGAHMNNILER